MKTSVIHLRLVVGP